MGLITKNSSGPRSNIIPLISITFGLFLLFLLFILINLDQYLDELQNVTATSDVNSQKMRLNTELMELARARTRLTSQILDTEDIFAQDELNMMLENYAGLFVAKRVELQRFELLPEEMEVLDRQAELVPLILPKQRQVVELAMSDNPGDRSRAQNIFYTDVLPRQGEMLTLLSKMIAIEQQGILEHGKESRFYVQTMKQRSRLLIGIIFIVVTILSAIVIIRIRRIQDDLLNSHDNLELKVLDRTRELRHAQGILSTVLDTIPVGVFWKDINGTYLGSNVIFARDTGHTTSAELIGKSDYDMPWGSMVQEFRDDDVTVIKSGKALLNKVVPHTGDNGSVVWIENSRVPLLNNNQEIVGILGIYQDITERKDNEERLIKAIAGAEQANLAKSQFMANMSHEIRTPMNSVLGMTHLVLQSNLTDSQKNYLQKVYSSAELLLGIINDILDFSKIEAGKLEFEQTEFVLESVFEQIVNIVGQKADEKGVELLFNISQDVPSTLVGDQLRLVQILVNLCINSVKFTEEGEILVSVIDEKREAGRIQLHFTVKDTGIGMDSEQASSLFLPFTQADASITRNYGGTGLGLAIVKRLTEMMGGEVWIDSRLNQGSCFHFTVELGMGIQEGGKAKSLSDLDLDTLNVMVVDDNLNSQNILRDQLAQYGMSVELYSSGALAIKHIDSLSSSEVERIDLILMDWKMPEMSGVETIKQLIERERPLAPIIIMTNAFDQSALLEQAKSAGVTLENILIKPVTASTLLDAVSESLGRGLATDNQDEQTDHTYQDSVGRLRGAHILLVEDNKFNQEFVVDLLALKDISVDLAINGQEAVEMVKANRYDGVLMDCQMPVMDGYAAVEMIRKDERYKDLPIVALTANVLEGEIDLALRAGMNDFIAKPINIELMFETMSRWFKPSVRLDASSDNVIADDSDVQDMEPQEEEIALPDLPGLDITAGLGLVSNNRKRYLKMLQIFIKTQSNKHDDIDRVLESGDLNEIERTAHSLKSVMGTIGATELQNAALEIELMAKDGGNRESINERFREFQQQFKVLYSRLEGSLVDR